MSEELIWNTLHPFGYSRFLQMYVKFLVQYDDDSAHRFGVGQTVGEINSICELLEQLNLNEMDWEEFKRRHPMLVGANDISNRITEVKNGD